MVSHLTLLSSLGTTMRGHGRPWFSHCTLAVTAVCTCLAILSVRLVQADHSIATETLPIAWQDDAELTDVFFLNAKIGWAVGAQGVILRTTDGGKTWLQSSETFKTATASRLQESIQDVPLGQNLAKMQQGPATRLTQRNVVADGTRRNVRIRFESVHFIDSQYGWIAGGYNLPWIERSRGVVMWTADGGRSWKQIERLSLPRVKKICFTSRRSGWAIGETNALHPDGIYVTNDGGKTWSSQSMTAMGPWQDGQQAGGQFALVDQNGRLAVAVGSTLKRPALFGCTRQDKVDRVVMSDQEVGFSVGRDGLVLKTIDGGTSWKRLKLDAEKQLTWGSSLRAITVHEDHLWMAPEDGGLIRLNVKDSLAKVSRIALPTSVPMTKIQFVDAKHGFAVGQLGTILATEDGGETWRKQQGEQDRLAMLLVASRSTDISLELLAINAGEESRLCGTYVFDDRGWSRAAAIHAFDRIGSAVNLCSAASANEHRLGDMASAIRSLRPLVVVCCHDLSSSDRYREALTLQKIVQDAIELAATDSGSGVHQNAWQVERLATSDLTGDIKIDSRRMMPSLGKTVDDQIVISRGILGQPVRGLNNRNWRITHPGPARRMKGNDFLSGLGRKGKPIPKRKRRAALGNLNRMNLALAKQKWIVELAEMNCVTDQEWLNWQQKLLPFASRMDADLAGWSLLDLADRYLSAGQFDMTDRTLELLSTYWANHAFAPAANAWLTVKRSEEIHANDVERTRDSQVLETLMKLTQSDPSIALEPAYQWLELNLIAKKTGLRSVESKLTQMAQQGFRGTANGQFVRAARTDLSLLHSAGGQKDASETSSSAGSRVCTFAKKRPNLDGKLDDSVWMYSRAVKNDMNFNHSEFYTLSATDSVCFAYDDEFFYGSIDCRKLDSQSYRFRRVPRPRDPDLSRRDRIELTIDPVVNYCGGVKLILDHRGWVAESKLGSKAWNPTWYVAQAEDAESWKVEFAIPLKELSQTLPTQAIHPVDQTARGWAIRLCRLDSRSSSVWGDVAKPVDSAGLQASLKPNPTGFQRLRFETLEETELPKRDLQVQAAQFELELRNADQNELRQAPQAPNFRAK